MTMNEILSSIFVEDVMVNKILLFCVEGDLRWKATASWKKRRSLTPLRLK